MCARQETCCFTGHRPSKLPWGYCEEDPRCLRLMEWITETVDMAYELGYRHFICGMAQGCDFYFCQSVLNLREKHPDVTLEAAIPCPTQADAWPLQQRERYQALLAACDHTTLVSAEYTPYCMQRRDRYMADRSSLLIAAFDGQSSGGTWYTIEYAIRRGLIVIDLPIWKL